MLRRLARADMGPECSLPRCAVFTVFEGLAVGAVSFRYPLALVIRAAVATAAGAGGLSAYALTTRRDFTVFGGLLSSAMMGLFVLGLMQFFMGGNLIHSLHAGLGTLVFCAYLVFNTQMMMGGNKKRRESSQHATAVPQTALSSLEP